jgi:hypothetical protein
MAFIFSTSHLPESRVRRPDHLDDEEEEDDVMQPMPRAGGVRAFSHLPQPLPRQVDTSGPLSTRPATPVGGPRPHVEPEDEQNTAEAPAADSNHDDDTRAHAEYTDDTPWHTPRIPAQDLPPRHRHEDEYAQEEDHPDPSMYRDGSRPRGSGFTPSPQDLHDAFHSLVPDSSQDTRPAQQRGITPFERQLPPGLRAQDMSRSRNLPGNLGSPFQTMVAMSAAPQDRPGASHQAPAGAVQSNPATETTPNASGGNVGSSALQEQNRIQLLDESAPIEPRQRIDGTSLKNKSPEQFAREKAAYLKAKAAAAANHKFNYENQTTLKAWQNYDRAIQMMDRTPEGHQVLEHLRNEKNRVFRVVMLNDPANQSYMGVKLSEGAQAQHIDTGKKDEQGREIHVIFLSKTALAGDVLKPNGEVNPDAESLEKIWHELYHASERHTSGGVDPLGLGTTSIRDRLFPQAHERRAVRFENIIRFRNGGTRKKDRYGGKWVRGADGQWRIVGEIDVPDALPPRPPLPSK